MKLTTKLVLGATVVAGLSVSAFAACANNVLMGDKQLKDVANGTDDKDAVNYGQVLSVSTPVDVPETNASRLKPHSESVGHNVEVRKIGNICFMEGLIKNVSGAEMTARTEFGIVPSGSRPTYRHYKLNYQSGDLGFIIETNGRLMIDPNGKGLGDQKNISVTTSYICQ